MREFSISFIKFPNGEDKDARAWSVPAYLAFEVEEQITKLEAECKRMYGVLDDISTAADQFKPRGCDGYFNAVEKLAQQGLNEGLFYSDGYEILRKPPIKDD